MEVFLIVLGLFLLISLFVYLLFLLGRWIDRYRIIKIDVPPHWFEILEKHFPSFSQLEESKKGDMMSALQIYMAEKDFVGKDGIKVDDEIRLLLSMQLITRAKGKDVFLDKLKDIYIYPSRKVPPMNLFPRTICMGFSLPLYSNKKELDLYFLNRSGSPKKRS